MLFNSYIFIFIFLPLVLLGWYGCNHLGHYRMAQVFLLGMSLWFYGYFHPAYVLLILLSMSGNWFISLLIGSPDERDKRRQTLLGWMGILFNLGILFYFKYYDFFITSVNSVFGTDWVLKHIVLPLGISFFTFQQISFVADRMCGRAPHYAALDYMCYVVYFPQLIAGPIVSHSDLIPQFFGEECRRFRWENLLCGIRLFTVGLAKKVLLADELGRVVDAGYSNVAALDTPGALAVMLAYTIQIFFDFSGYSDMALGLAKMMGLDLPVNFRSPYKSHSVREFWNRWHMTLNTFFTKYVYIPLGGNRKGRGRQVSNTMIVFLLSGLWHGAEWSFVLWGMLHGIMVSAESVWEGRKAAVSPGREMGRMKRGDARPKQGSADRIAGGFRWAVTFGFVNLAWVLFRSDSIGAAIVFYKRLASFSWNGSLRGLASAMGSYRNYPLYLLANRLGGETGVQLMYLCWMLVFLLLAAVLCTGPDTLTWVRQKRAGAVQMWGLACLFFLCVLSFSGLAVFLYFNF